MGFRVCGYKLATYPTGVSATKSSLRGQLLVPLSSQRLAALSELWMRTSEGGCGGMSHTEAHESRAVLGEGIRTLCRSGCKPGDGALSTKHRGQGSEWNNLLRDQKCDVVNHFKFSVQSLEDCRTPT